MGGAWRFRDHKAIVKAKVTPNMTCAISVNNALGLLGTYSLGLQVKELGRKNQVSFGSKVWIDL